MNAPGVLGLLAIIIRFEPYLAGFPEGTLSYYDTAPLWMYVMWGGSIMGGLIGSILLLLRRSIAVPVTAVAWICSVVAVAYALVNPAPDGGSPLFMAAVLVIALLILLYMRWMQTRGVLR
jgi:hypothetical protein